MVRVTTPRPGDQAARKIDADVLGMTVADAAEFFLEDPV